MSILPRRKVEIEELTLLDAIESIGVDKVQDILRMDMDTLKSFHSYLGVYISKLEVEAETRKINLNK